VENRVNIQAKGKKSWTALLRAALEGEEAMVELLLESGANIEATNITGCTALYKSAVKGHEAIVKLLLGKGLTLKRRTEKDVQHSIKQP
jgi:ankyrin repeat protein